MQSNRPKPDSQAGRILALLELARGGKVTLPEILALRVSQYNARIFELRHKYGFHIENGTEPGRSDHTWFRLISEPRPLSPVPVPSRDPDNPTNLFTHAELQRTARWEDHG